MTENKAAATEEAERKGGVFELGTEDRPYPMIKKSIGSDGRFKQALGVLSDGSLKINSDRTEDEILGMAFRDMPSPGMLKMFLEGSIQRETNDPRKVEFMMGDPGAGKSFLANLHAKMRTNKGALLVDCGGRDLSELLYETVLDYDGGKSVYQEIDAKLGAGEMSPASMKLLQKALGDSMSVDGATGAIDWQGVSGKEDVEAAIDAVRKVADMEGLGKGGDVSIGLTTKEGPIMHAWRENRPLILDEYNKAKPGTDDALQILWQVFNGEMDKHTVKGGGGKSFTFSKDEMPDKFFVTLTGNLTKDGYSTRSLSSSAYQRLQPQYIEAPTEADWQHRICQKLTGMPVSTIYKANEEYWKGHKDEFTDYLIDLRKKGMSEEQQANIPTWQFAMLKNWENVLTASEQLSGFYDKWAQVVDPNSKLHEEAQMGNNSKVAELLDEVDENYAAEVGVGLRRMLRHIDKTTIISPEVKLGGEIRPRGEREHVEPDPTEKEFGTRLSNVILEDINATAEGREKLMDWLLVRSAEAGLFEMIMEEGRTTGDRLISNLLDIDPEKQREIPENIEEIHTMLCDYLRQKYEGMSAENTDIISPAKLEHVLSELGGQKEVERMTDRSGVLMLPNEDVESLTEQPIAPAIGVDGAKVAAPAASADEEVKQSYEKIQKQEEGLEDVLDVPTQDLVNSERFLISLAIPSVKKNNIEATFAEKNFQMSVLEEDVSYAALNGTASHGVGVNMLATKTVDANGQEQDEYLYVVHDKFANRGEGRTLVTGSSTISPKLQDALEKNGVTYVNRSEDGAKEKINGTIEEIIADKRDIPGCEMCIEHIMTTALAFRNPYSAPTQDGKWENLYELPNHELIYSDNPPALSDEVRGKHRENLVSLLSDEGKYLDKTTGHKAPFMLTDSPDMDKLKHTLRALSQGGQQQAGGMSK